MLSLSGLFQALLFLAGIIAVNSSTYVSVVYSPVIVIAVESERYDDLEDSIKTFRNDLTVDGWVTDLRLIKKQHKASGLHQFLDNVYSERQIYGAVLVGNFPYNPNGNGGDRLLASEYNPSDWKTNLVGMYSVRPRFWISRIDPTPLAYMSKMQNNQRQAWENQQIKAYFSRNHQFRKCPECFKNEGDEFQYIYSYHKYSDYLLMPSGWLMHKSSVHVNNANELLSALEGSGYYRSFIIAHGNCQHIALTRDVIYWQRVLMESRANSRIIVLNSCSTGCITKSNPASAFLFAPNGKTLAVVAPQEKLPVTSYVESFRDSSGVNSRTLGEAHIRGDLMSSKSFLNTLFSMGLTEGLLNQLPLRNIEMAGGTLTSLLNSEPVNILLTVLIAYMTYELVQKVDMVLLGDGTLM